MDPVTYSIASVLAVSLVSLIGIAAFSLREELVRRSMLVLVGLAAGALLGDAVVHLIPEAIETIGDELSFGTAVLSGVVLFFILEKYLRWHHAHHVREEEHAGHEQYETGSHETKIHLAPMVLIADGLHNMIDGAVIAASYLISPAVGIATTIAVFIHEIPQEISDYALLVHAGYTRTKALTFNFLSALTALLGAAFVLWFGAAVESFGAYAAAVTAGAFIYLAAVDLIPELNKRPDQKRGIAEIVAFLVGLALMLALTFLET